MNEFDYEDGCSRCGDTGCDECAEPDECEREELDEARGICRECDTWGEIQCRRHGDIVLEAMAHEARCYWLSVYARRGKHTKASRKARFRINAMWWTQ